MEPARSPLNRGLIPDRLVMSVLVPADPAELLGTLAASGGPIAHPGGSSVTGPGAAAQPLELLQPQDLASLGTLLGSRPEVECSARTARGLAMGAFWRALRRHPPAAVPGDSGACHAPRLLGIACLVHPLDPADTASCPTADPGAGIWLAIQSADWTESITFAWPAHTGALQTARQIATQLLAQRLTAACRALTGRCEPGTAADPRRVFPDPGRTLPAKDWKNTSVDWNGASVDWNGASGEWGASSGEWNSLSGSCAVPVGKGQLRRTLATAAWSALLLGQTPLLPARPSRTLSGGGKRDAAGSRPAAASPTSSAASPTSSRLVFPGAFSPRHAGHLRMAQLAAGGQQRVEYEISIENVDKPPLDYTELTERVRQFSPRETLWLTRAPTFVAKAQLFPGATFVVGADTIARVADRAYYASGPARDAAIQRIADQGCRFLVFGRVGASGFIGLDDLELPPALRKLCQGVAEHTFRRDISSSQIRRERRQPS